MTEVVRHHREDLCDEIERRVRVLLDELSVPAAHLGRQ